MLFFKRKLITYEQERICAVKRSYKDIVNIAEASINNKSPKEQLIILNYLIESISDEICASTVNELLTKKTNGILPIPFPEHCISKNGVYCNPCTDIKKLVDLSKVKVYVRPWNIDRLFRNLVLIGDNDFKYDMENHYSIFYSDINLCYVYNGNHSINAGRYFKQGEIYSNEYDMSLLYLNCRTDGLDWYDIHSNKILCRVYDFRFAAIFSLAQIRYNIILSL